MKKLIIFISLFFVGISQTFALDLDNFNQEPTVYYAGESASRGNFYNNGNNLYFTYSKQTFFYSLSTPYDPHTRTLITTLSNEYQFYNDGYIVLEFSVSGSTIIYKSYSLTSPYDLTTKTELSAYYTFDSIWKADFIDNGTKFLFSEGNFLKSYDLTIPYDLTSKTNLKTRSWSLSKLPVFNDDGTKAFGYGGSHIINEYSLSIPYDIDTITFVKSKQYNDYFSFIGGFFNDDYSKLYTYGGEYQGVFTTNYSLGPPEPELNSAGEFNQTSGGFELSGFQGTEGGTISFQIGEVDTGNVSYTPDYNFYADTLTSIKIEDSDLFNPDTEYIVEGMYTFSGSTTEFMTPYTFTTPGYMYLLPDEGGTCPEGTFNSNMWILDGYFDVCLFEPETPEVSIDGTTITSSFDDNDVSVDLTGSGLLQDINITVDNNDDGLFDSLKNKLDDIFNGDVDTGTGISEGEGIGGDFNFDTISGEGLGGTGSIIGNIGNSYGDVIVDNMTKQTCKMFNTDGSFRYYSNGGFAFSLDFTNTGTMWDKIMWLPQKFVNIITAPINNVISIFRTIGTVENGTSLCYFGQVQKVEYQKFMVGFSQSENIIVIPQLEEYRVQNGDMTYIDYLVLGFFGIIFFGMALFILKP